MNFICRFIFSGYLIVIFIIDKRISNMNLHTERTDKLHKLFNYYINSKDSILFKLFSHDLK